MALRPMRPMSRTLPVPAIPATRAPKMSGATMALIRRRKTLASAAIQSALPMFGKSAPTATPSSMAKKIQAVSEGRLTCDPASPFAPLQFLAQHIEEEHFGRPNQVNFVLRAAAHDAIVWHQRLAHLPVHREVG